MLQEELPRPVALEVDGSSQAHAATGQVMIFLDLDTVMLAEHQGRYGPELGLQSGLPEAIERMSEITDRIVVLADPSRSDLGRANDTQQRIAVLREGLGDKLERLTIASCQHGETGDCDCAKPGHGLIDQVVDGHAGTSSGWYIGGDQEGMVAGRGAGLRTIRIGPHGEDHLSTVHRPDYEARDLRDAANHILVEELVSA